MNIGTVVEHKGDGTRGVVVSNFLGSCTDEEIPVVWEGTNYFSGTDPNELTVIGPENAVADKDKCGSGEGEKACIFLVYSSSKGFECQRFGLLRNDLIFRNMRAKRHPVEMFPNCQLQVEGS
jgi:hypothetical protein